MRAKLFLTGLLFPVFLAFPALAATDVPLVKKNFTAGSPEANPDRPPIGNLFNDLFGKRKFVIEDALDDPEVVTSNPDAGFDAYKPEKLVSLAQADLTGASLFTPLSGNVLDALRDPTLPIELRAAEKAAVLNFYTERGFAPAWVARDMGLKPEARALLNLLERAAEHGLEARDYMPIGLTSFADDGAVLKGNDAALGRVDAAITAMAVRFARELHSGRIIPNRLSGYYDIEPPEADLLAMLKDLAKASDPAFVMAGFAPPHPEYAAMKAELAKQRDLLASEEPPFPEGPHVNVGQKDPRIPALRERMLKDGILTSAPPEWANEPAGEASLDKPLSEALKAFQQKAGIKATGALDAATVSAFNANSARENVERLTINMERMRWLPRDLGPRYIFANQPAFELRVMNNGAEEWRTRVIVGKPNTQTSVFTDEMEFAVFNPTWGVPQSIIIKEMLPQLQRDPSYLDRQGFQISDQQGNIISSRRIDWSDFSNRVPLNVIQPAGGDNALGEVKFMFPNTHNIYMHDTPKRKLFEDEVRAYSHGCVRVQDPRRFAEIVLGWTSDQVAEAIGSGRTNTVHLPQKLPVYLQYFTVWPQADGKMVYYKDIYNRDARLSKAFNALVQIAQQ